jgi:nitrite reductase/ring-hydroxylating ferredoxin subunit
MSTNELTWHPAGPLVTLPRGGTRVVSVGAARIAVFHLEDGTLAALDDRCPHEGFPLAKGFVNQGVVTCRWHAFRFELKSGRCLVGDEHATSYPVRVVGDQLEVGVARLDPRDERRRFEASLQSGLFRRRLGQVARDVARLLVGGATPRDILRLAVFDDATRAPYGLTHVLAVAHDLEPRLSGIALRLGDDGLIAALLQPLDLCAEPLAYQPLRPRAMPATLTGGSPEKTFLELRRRVEAEDADGAEALIRGAVLDDTPLETLAAWFRALVNDHLLDIGHAAIYYPKVFGWLAAEPTERARDSRDLVLGAYVRHIAMGTREELLPEWQSTLRAIADASPVSDATPDDLRRALLQGPRDAVIPATKGALQCHELSTVIDTLVIAACVRLLRFDLSIERDPTVQDGWLDATHDLTLASALREAGDTRLVLLTAASIQRRSALDAPADTRSFDESTLAPRMVLEDVDAAEDLLHLALDRRDADAIVAPAHQLAKAAPALLIDLLEDHVLTRAAGRPIFAAHHHKVMLAALSEHHRLRITSPANAHLPLIAAARFVASPLQERPIMRLAHEANRFVRQSRVPRRLA